MSIDMYVSASQAQAKSVTTLCQQQKQGYEELQRAISDFTDNSFLLQGGAYDSAKQFFTAVLFPLAKGGILLSEAVMEACQKFPEEYMSQVDSGDLKESELTEKISRLTQQMNQLEILQTSLRGLMYRQQQDGTLDGSLANRMYGNQQLMNAYARAKQELEALLQKLIAFNASSPSIFSEIEALKSAVAQGTAQANSSWNPGIGTFSIPKGKNMAWVEAINEAELKREISQFEGCELIYHQGTTEVAPYYTISKIGNSAEENARLTNLYYKLLGEGKFDSSMLTGLNSETISTDDLLVKVTDDSLTIYQKYILCAAKGIHPHTGLKLTDAEKNQFLYAGIVGPAFGTIGQIYGAFMGGKAANWMNKVPKTRTINGKTYVLDRNKNYSGGPFKKGDSERIKQPIENGPYIKNGKPNGRPQLSGEKKLQFEKDVYNNQVDPDGILRDPNTGEIIDWKPGDPRKNKVDFGHKEGNSYKNMFEKYKNGEITLDELKEFQFNSDNFRLETPSANRSHKYE